MSLLLDLEELVINCSYRISILGNRNFTLIDHDTLEISNTFAVFELDPNRFNTQN